MKPTGIKIVKLDGSPLWDRDSNNPIDYLPPIGSIIFYKTFRSNERMKNHKITDYVLKVENIEFHTEEGFNGMYINKSALVIVKVIHESTTIQNPTEQ